MLNPSTADADADDHTVRKCVGFAERLGYGALLIANLWAYRAMSPLALKRAGFPVGPDNDDYLIRLVSESQEVICAWGINARGTDRPAAVLSMITMLLGRPPMALKILPCGNPSHPLMLPYSCQPVRMGGL